MIEGTYHQTEQHRRRVEYETTSYSYLIFLLESSRPRARDNRRHAWGSRVHEVAKSLPR